MSQVVPQTYVSKPRNKFDLSYGIFDSCNIGDLVPFYIQEIYPGDTFNCKSRHVIRTTSPFIRPIMDNLYVDKYYFWVPNRLVYNKWKEVFGENNDSYWTNTENVEVPTIEAEGQGIGPNTIASHFGITNGAMFHAVNVLPFRAFALIYNEYFRDQNTQAPAYINKDYDFGNYLLNNEEWSVDNIFGLVPKANKFHDYFTDCLPEPLKGEEPIIPLSDDSDPTNNISPVFALSEAWSPDTPGYEATNPLIYDTNTFGLVTTKNLAGSSVSGVIADADASLGSSMLSAPLNLASFNAINGGIRVSDVLTAFSYYKLLSLNALSGTRYQEIIHAQFGVYSPDSALQIPELLGGKREPLTISQTVQTSESTASSPLAQVGAYSLSGGECGYIKSFTEHGFVIGVMCIRQYNTYQQGIDKFWFRTNMYDYYNTNFANLPEQPVYTKELDASVVDGEQIFGYQEAWYDLRTRISRVQGQLRSEESQSLDVWHLAEEFNNTPVLNSEFKKQTTQGLDRALSVPSSSLPNFIYNIYHEQKAVRVLPLYSKPLAMI